MKCRDFERAWNELIEAEAGGGGRPAPGAGRAGRLAPGTIAAGPCPAVADAERALLDHAAECPACGRVGARYQVLRRAIRAWGPPPAPPAGFADRVLAEIQTPAPSAWSVYGPVRRRLPRTRVMISIMAAAMAASVLLVFNLDRVIVQRRPNDRVAALPDAPVDPRHNEGRKAARVGADARALNVALAEATAATWDLARSTSEPAARISRHVLGTAAGPDGNPARPASVTGSGAVAATVSVPSLDLLAPDTAAAGAVLQQVGDRLTAGVRPLSDTARHAFGFLLGTTGAKPHVPSNPPAQKGA